jgi:hypothetical protein
MARPDSPEDEPSDACDLAELPAPELGGVQTREDVVLDIGCGEQLAQFTDRQGHGGGREQSEAVIIGGKAERARRGAREPVRKQRREAQMREPPLERIEEQAMAFGRGDRFDEPFVRAG